MEITFLGHSCFLLDDGRYKVLTDPYLNGNPLAAAKAEDIHADFILVSHGHHDHLGDSVSIAKRCKATVCTTADLGELFAGTKTVAGNIGGTVCLPFGTVKYFQALHGCVACGFVIGIGGKKIYFAGDTALMSDMALLTDEGIDLALLPIGDHYTMGPEDALRAVKMIRPKLVIPMHYDTFPPIKQDAEAFAQSVKAAGYYVKVLSPGESDKI